MHIKYTKINYTLKTMKNLHSELCEKQNSYLTTHLSTQIRPKN